ncbi:MAG: DMT family transporter [Holophagae bacterium]
MDPVLGEIASLSAALLWATAVVLFRTPIAVHGARTVNLLKCLLGTVLLAATLPLVGGFGQLAGVAGRDLALIAASGVVGLTLGDTALFAAVGRIGAHRTLLIQTLAPVFAGGLAAAVGERLTAGQLVGAAVVLGGIAVVVGPLEPATARHRRVTGAGLALGLLAAFGQGAGVVIAKAGMEDIAILPATLVRLGAAAAGLLVVAALGGRLTGLGRVVRHPSTLRRLLPASFIGTYLALLLMTAGIILAPATIAAVLLATTPIFGLVVEAVADRRRPTAVELLGTLLAVAGVAILVLS